MNAAAKTAYLALPHTRRTRTAFTLARAGLPIEILAERSDDEIVAVASACGARDQPTIIAAIIAAFGA